jgi:transporter family protein
MKLFSDWRFLSIMAIFAWGFWGFFSKLAENHLDWKSTYALFSVSAFIVLIIISPKSLVVCWHSKYALIGIAAGVFCGFGYIFFYRALSKANASAVIPISSLYIVVSACLVFVFLKEPVTWKNICGILSAILAVVLLSV